MPVYVTRALDYPSVVDEDKSSVNLGTTADQDNKEEVVRIAFTLLQFLLYNTNFMFSVGCAGDGHMGYQRGWHTTIF